MNQPVALLPPSPHAFHWPVDVTRYDRSPDLHEAERIELTHLMQQPPFQLRPSTHGLLHRLLQPIQDVFALTHPSPTVCHETMRIMVIEMYHRGRTFWAWSEEEWIDIIGSSYAAFARRYGRTSGVGQHPTRRELPVLAYLLCTPANIDPLLLPFAIAPHCAESLWHSVD
jgi:hypothetical protein